MARHAMSGHMPKRHVWEHFVKHAFGHKIRNLSKFMVTRKVLNFNTILGFTLPKQYCDAMELKKGDYVEVYLGTNKTIIVKKRQFIKQNITTADTISPAEEGTNNV